eukprot:COSAG01_NODE_48034_length_384_cov_2.564912_2_plen_100_part_01
MSCPHSPSPNLCCLPSRFHPQFRDRNSRGIGKPQSKYTAVSDGKRPAHAPNAGLAVRAGVWASMTPCPTWGRVVGNAWWAGASAGMGPALSTVAWGCCCQ